ncbi:HEPN domain-containing protein [Agrobacterium tumefaciens]
MSLKPHEQVQKLLLSTPARFVGEFDTPNILITHAWPPLHGQARWFSDETDSLRRTAIILAFETPAPPAAAPGVVIPNYEAAGEVVASTLSVLFGKRFDSHGPIEMSGFYGVPDFSTFATPCNPQLIHNNSTPRANRAIPLNLSEVNRIAGLFTASSPDPRLTAFHSAARFYRRALIAAETDPESAYLNLVTAGEIVANFHIAPDEDTLDNEARAVLERIESECSDGKKLSNFLRGRLRGIKRRFVSAISSMIHDNFFESADFPGHGEFRKEDFAKRIGAAYDLRSQFVHSGSPFGMWIRAGASSSDTQLGRPVVENTEMAKVLAMAPLFTGLERVIRYTLLSFAIELGADV